eukprot:TRINITY_DN29222_c0_g1_i1.p1 TRINITY_DN29222_c0_g1~~TRINITY_DN29222_c0_g1_i1.p1  ORF type:complete len:211 (-),score=23.81 TRINITY_DN29222_c0_g1_i1:11-643(-)
MMAKRSCPGRSKGFYDDSFVDRVFINKRVKVENVPHASRKNVQDLKRVITHAIMKKLTSKRRCSSVAIPQPSVSVFLSIFKSKKVVMDLKRAQSVLGDNKTGSFKLRTSPIYSAKQRSHELVSVELKLHRDNVWAYENNFKRAVKILQNFDENQKQELFSEDQWSTRRRGTKRQHCRRTGFSRWRCCNPRSTQRTRRRRKSDGSNSFQKC